MQLALGYRPYQFPSPYTEKTKLRQDPGLGWQIEHVHRLRLLVLALQTRLKLQELTQLAGEEAMAT